jgi:hypothetical protein
MLRDRVMVGSIVFARGRDLGCPKKLPAKVEDAIRRHLNAGREWHTEGGGAGRRRQRDCAAGAEGDDFGSSEGGVIE